MISPLHFDSNLFGYPVGKVIIEADFDEREFCDQAKDFQLIYLFSTVQKDFVSEKIIEVDKKNTFQKNIQKAEIQDDIQSFKGSLTNKLLQLAFQSGEYSRFKTDPRLSGEEFRSLYKLWISKAIDSNSILTTADQSGMITYSISEDCLHIGLIAVDEIVRGKGIGKKLMHGAEQKAFELGLKTILVPTQEDNLTACRFYESLDYTMKDKIYVYHWWKG